MDEVTVRNHVQEHAGAVERGDVDAVAADLSEDLRPQLPQILQNMPQPVTKAEVLSVEVGEPASIALIRYSGDSDAVTIRSEWREQGGRPLIVHAEFVG
jgi:hypothetical protein